MNQRGFMLLSAVFLTLIVSFVAMMTLQAMTHAKNSDAALRLQAINLANEQFALIESGSNKNIPDEDLKSYGLYLTADVENKTPIEFKVTKTLETSSGNLYKYKVTVNWEGNPKPVEFEKIVRLNSE